jgi:hypothetical protein
VNTERRDPMNTTGTPIADEVDDHIIRSEN